MALSILVVGLLVFVAVHSLGLFVPQLQQNFTAKHGKLAWRGIHSVFSLLSLVAIIWAYGMCRADPTFIWNPPVWTRHIALTFNLLMVILLTSSYIPNNHIKAKIGHPMYAAIKIWAFAHLLANGRLSDILLFGAFLIWAIMGFVINRKRDRLLEKSYGAGTLKGTVTVLVVALLVYFLIVKYLHVLAIGVSPI